MGGDEERWRKNENEWGQDWVDKQNLPLPDKSNSWYSDLACEIKSVWSLEKIWWYIMMNNGECIDKIPHTFKQETRSHTTIEIIKSNNFLLSFLQHLQQCVRFIRCNISGKQTCILRPLSTVKPTIFQVVLTPRIPAQHGQKFVVRFSSQSLQTLATFLSV